MGTIKLKAVYTKDHRVKITDQDGRSFDARDPYYVAIGQSAADVVTTMQVELELPQPWTDHMPYAAITIRVPLELE